MKKLVFILLAAVALVFATSSCQCSNDAQFGIVYSLQSDGKTDGFVQVDFINGNFKVTGDATYEFGWSNDKPQAYSATKVEDLEKALQSNDEQLYGAANNVNNWLEESIKVTDYEGYYDIHVKGYVMETFTKIKFEIDRHFTNIPPNAPVAE